MLKTVKLDNICLTSKTNVLNKISETNNQMAKFGYSVINYDIHKDNILLHFCDVTITYSNDGADVVKKPAIKKFQLKAIKREQFGLLVNNGITILMNDIGYKLIDIDMDDCVEDGNSIDVTLIYQLENIETGKNEQLNQQTLDDDSVPDIVKTNINSMIIGVLSILFLFIILLSIDGIHRIFCSGHDKKDDKCQGTISEQYDALVIQGETNSVYQILK